MQAGPSMFNHTRLQWIDQVKRIMPSAARAKKLRGKRPKAAQHAYAFRCLVDGQLYTAEAYTRSEARALVKRRLAERFGELGPDKLIVAPPIPLRRPNEAS